MPKKEVQIFNWNDPISFEDKEDIDTVDQYPSKNILSASNVNEIKNKHNQLMAKTANIETNINSLKTDVTNLKNTQISLSKDNTFTGSNTFNKAINMNLNRISNIGTPSSARDAANKDYVDYKLKNAKYSLTSSNVIWKNTVKLPNGYSWGAYLNVGVDTSKVISVKYTNDRNFGSSAKWHYNFIFSWWVFRGDSNNRIVISGISPDSSQDDYSYFFNTGYVEIYYWG